MNTINFQGIKGTVVDWSPHGNYLVIKLSRRVYICGTYSNKWNWQEQEDAAPFLSFITYIGMDNQQEGLSAIEWAIAAGGWFKHDEDEPRFAKRIVDSILEIKVRGLSSESVCHLAKLDV